MSTSTIHDIGYRHYDGRRNGRAYVIRSLYVHNLRAAFGLGRPVRAKIMPFVLAALMLLPAAGSVAAFAFTKQEDALIPYASYANLMQVIVAIFLATQAPVLASREVRFHVVPLYFSRPVGHLDFVLAKGAAMATALLALLAVPVTVLYVGGLVTKAPDSSRQLLDYLGGLVGCVLYALVLAAIGMVVAAFTPRRGFGVAAVIAAYMVPTAVATAVQGIAEAETNFTLQGWMGLLAPFNLVDIVQVRLLGAETSSPGIAPGVTGGLVALALCAAIVLGSIAVLYRRFRKAGLS
ncbi:ABC-2 type transport system permease protein [Actinomadura pelletieri DSM 43383]|uniref:ABC-2 type transport system permease protein n=1 Tax=Actinomadura pelletieri DSM 43383 TaxID=1120940 RepID=A0A495QRP1_9ACTN|nr:ABC transporter permease [Actinomadura pelletieri]RKS76137.1 ABC-2 type transport system permease protein [Actinomadura pelletieri DSM 43383]